MALQMGADVDTDNENGHDNIAPSREECNDGSSNLRQGTVTSARFNLLSSMVGGGSLSLPLAFHQAGNAFLGPFFLVLVAAAAEFSIRALISAAQATSESSCGSTPPKIKGTVSYESVASAAFGPKARYLSMGLVSAICFFATVGYAVLLRDLLEPLADVIFPPPDANYDGPTLARNGIMLFIMLLVTPLCTLQNLTALQSVGAASMLSVLILGSCVGYRSAQCNFGASNSGIRHSSWFDYLTAFPSSVADFLNALPLLISCFVCHFNVLPVHNELRNANSARVSWLVRSTTWSAVLFYLFIGVTGSMYGNCTPTGTVQGNILLDFDEDDPLLMVGRVCLALTVTFAFPMLVVPSRDTLLRALHMYKTAAARGAIHPVEPMSGPLSHATSPHRRLTSNDESIVNSLEIESDIREPLLTRRSNRMDTDQNHSASPAENSAFSAGQTVSIAVEDNPMEPACATTRIVTAIVIFWTGAAVACSVKSIDTIWDLLGSSLSILLAFLIPLGSYLVLVSRCRVNAQQSDNGGSVSSRKHTFSTMLAWLLVSLFVPLMLVCTANAVYNTFFRANGESATSHQS